MEMHNVCGFYDKWVAHDITGKNFMTFGQVVIDPDAEHKLNAKKPFQVFSCWNGMVVFDADVFQKERLLFRTSRANIGECAASEADLIIRDMTSIGRGKIAVSPHAASAYTDDGFKKCASEKQPKKFERAEPIQWAAAPENVQCCPIRNDADVEHVNFKWCFSEKWDRFGHDVPRQMMPHIDPKTPR